MKCGPPSAPWQRMRASRSTPAWVSHCKYSTCSHRFPWTSRSRHRYLSPSPTAQNPPFTEDGAQSKAVFHLSARKSGHHTLSKVLGEITRQPSEGVDCPPSPAASDNSAGSGEMQGSRCRSRSRAQSITPAHSWRSGSVGSVACHHSVRSHAIIGGEESSSESELSYDEEDAVDEDE